MRQFLLTSFLVLFSISANAGKMFTAPTHNTFKYGTGQQQQQSLQAAKQQIDANSAGINQAISQKVNEFQQSISSVAPTTSTQSAGVPNTAATTPAIAADKTATEQEKTPPAPSQPTPTGLPPADQQNNQPSNGGGGWNYGF